MISQNKTRGTTDAVDFSTRMCQCFAGFRRSAWSPNLRGIPQWLLAPSAYTLRPFVSGNIATIFPPSAAQLGSKAQWVAVLVALFGLLLAAFSARWAAKQWRLQYFNKEWVEQYSFSLPIHNFWTLNTNRQYRENNKQDELLKYQLVAPPVDRLR